MKLQAVIFDMDGTLFDSERIAQKIWYQLGEEFDLPVSDSFLRELAGRDWNSAKNVFERYFPQEWPLEKVKERQKELFAQFYQNNGADVKKGFYDILNYLYEKKIPMAIATSSFPLCVEANLQHAQAQHYFQSIVTGYDSDVKAGKPAPDIYECAAKRLHVPIKQCIVVEDSPSGILAANAAQAMPLLIPDAAYVNDAIRKKAKWILKSLDEMIPLLEKEESSYDI